MQRFRTLSNHVRVGDYLFVHAGIHPDIGLAMLACDWRKLPGSWAEEGEDPLWIRGPFLTYDRKHEGGVIVVHGQRAICKTPSARCVSVRSIRLERPYVPPRLRTRR